MEPVPSPFCFMPIFHVKSLRMIGFWAALKKDGTLGWTHHVGATAFDSAEQARERIEAAALLTFEHGLQKHLADKAKGYILSADWQGRKVKKVPHLKDRLPDWLSAYLSHDDQARAYRFETQRFAGSIVVESRATDEDVLGAFETYYARCDRGWLGGPRLKAHWGRFEWRPSFSDAQGFASLASLMEAASSTGQADFSVIKSRSVFTDVEFKGSPQDAVSSRLRSACEAREIDSELVAAAEARLAALRASEGPSSSATPAPAPKRSRI